MYTVLVLSCHPDDMEIACAGTLLKCKERGDRVVVCHLSSGNLGHEIIPPDELTDMRAAEAKRSCDIAGFEVMYGGFDDLDIYDNNKEARDKVVNIIKKVDPDFIITHSPDDYMPDHTAVSKLAFDACFAATLPNYHVETEGHARLVPLYYMDTLAGVNFNPTQYVDISDEIDLKLKMLECHESQIKWMRDHDHIDFPEFVRSCSRVRGIQCNVQYAEGFTQELVWPKVLPKRLLP